tara:strand:- start:1354 stop:1770 length:417 start_codon:yes stop_codon:yes gene_type:complete
MGDYTGVRFTAVLNDLGFRVAGAMGPPRHASWVDLARDIPELAIPRWASMGRAGFIPRGIMSYMPDDWQNENEVVNGRWHVCCSLKNYKGEIAVFLDEVLPQLIREPCEVEVLFEGDRNDCGRRGRGPTTTTIEPRED